MTDRVACEASSEARTGAVNEMDQRAWFLFIDSVRKTLSELSPGLYQGMPYDYWRKHFIVASDEENVQASADGKKLVGKKGKQLHLKNSEDNRKSGTALRTGSDAAVKGPSMYILEGSTPEPYITVDFLVRNGAPPGSIYCVNPSAYMTDHTFDDNIEELCMALRNMDPVVAANPDWWMEWHVDGFKSKVDTLKGQRMLRQYKIKVVVMFSKTSHVNQVS